MATILKNARGQVVAALNTGLPMSDEPMPSVVAQYLDALQQTSRELAGILS